MHATQISTCARNSRRAVPPTPCRSRPPAPCRRRVGQVERCSTWTWGCGRGSTSHPPWQFGSTRHPVPRHVAGTTIPNTSATETNGPRPALQTKFTTPHRARQLAGHHRWDVDDPKKPPLQKLWTPPTRGCAPVQGTGTSLVTGGTSHLRGISVRQDPPCHATWQTPRSQTHLPQTCRATRDTPARGPAEHDPRRYSAPPWYFGSTSRPVPHHVANPTIPNTSATGSLGQDSLGRPDHHLTRARAHFHLHCKTCSVSESASCGLVLHSLHP